MTGARTLSTRAESAAFRVALFRSSILYYNMNIQFFFRNHDSEQNRALIS